MKDYASMSDQQINQLVGCKVGEVQLGARSACCIGSDGNVLVLKGGMWTIFDPCNNPADAWPILVDNKITIDAPLPQHEYWTAEKRDTDGGLLDFHVGINPMRCAMIVFLMMKEGKND